MPKRYSGHPNQYPGRESSDTWVRLIAENSDEPFVSVLELRRADAPGSVNDDTGVCGEQPIRAYSTVLIEAAADEVGYVETNGILILASLAGDLAKNQVMTPQSREDQRGTPFGLAEVREREVDDNDVALYKLAQAASSSGASQSFVSEDSAAKAGMDASDCSSESVWRNCSKRSRSFSDSLSNS